MQKLSQFLDFGSIDSKLYWRIPCQKGSDLFEVQWRKGYPTPWRYRRVGEIFWTTANGEELEAGLERDGADVLSLEAKVRYSTLQQVAFANKIVEDAKSQFGSELVLQAIAENNAFMSQLEDAIKRLTLERKTTNTKARLQLIKN